MNDGPGREGYPSDRASRSARALDALEGLATGDALGETFFRPDWVPDVELEVLPPATWRWTDDTNMAASIVEVLAAGDRIDQDALAASFLREYDVRRGYGPAMHTVFAELAVGRHWRVVSRGLFDGSGSFGNGSAMRVAPLGAYFADDLATCAEQAALSAEVTHAHAEAIAGAVAVAGATAVAYRLRFDEQDCGPREFLESVIEITPPSHVRDRLHRAMRLGPHAAVDVMTFEIGNGSDVTCMDTVPFVIWSAARALDDFESAIWNTIRGGGDRDTTTAMVGGILAGRLGANAIPAEWIARREPLPAWIRPDEPAGDSRPGA